MLEKAEKWVMLFVVNCLFVGSIVSLYCLAYILIITYSLIAALQYLK